MLHKITTFIDEGLYQRFKAAAGDVPLARKVRRLIEQDVDQAEKDGQDGKP